MKHLWNQEKQETDVAIYFDFPKGGIVKHGFKDLPAKDKKFYWLLCNRINIVPGKLKLYEIAFLHRSASVIFTDGTVINNERLEYLGDAILDAVIADYLFKKFPRKKEGFLTQMRSKIVKRSNLDHLARQVGVDELIVSNTNRNIHKKLFTRCIRGAYRRHIPRQRL
ncbi:MAG: ribonuclease III family protein [Bacteroidetes bacterium]|nr:ribonuclease III family protein [Bacteroidota bacterium]